MSKQNETTQQDHKRSRAARTETLRRREARAAKYGNGGRQ